MPQRTAEDLLERIRTLSPEKLKKEKGAVIGQIVRGDYTKEDQIVLRRELQKKLIEEGEVKDRILAELQGTEEEIKRQCTITSEVSKRLVESDGKLSRVKRGQEVIAEEMAKAEKVLQKRRRNEFQDELAFLGVIGLFFTVCIYIVVDRLLLR